MSTAQGLKKFPQTQTQILTNRCVRNNISKKADMCNRFVIMYVEGIFNLKKCCCLLFVWWKIWIISFELVDVSEPPARLSLKLTSLIFPYPISIVFFPFSIRIYIFSCTFLSYRLQFFTSLLASFSQSHYTSSCIYFFLLYIFDIYIFKTDTTSTSRALPPAVRPSKTL